MTATDLPNRRLHRNGGTSFLPAPGGAAVKPVCRSGGSHASASCHQILNAGTARDSRSNRVSPLRKTTPDKSANDVTSAFGVAIRAYTDPGHVTHRKWAICAPDYAASPITAEHLLGDLAAPIPSGSAAGASQFWHQIQLKIMKLCIRIRCPASSCACATHYFRHDRADRGIERGSRTCRGGEVARTRATGGS